MNVYVIDGNRTPFIKARGIPGPWSASDLAVEAGKALLMRQNFSPEKIDEMILGCVMSSPEEANIARVVALRLGCSIKTPAWTVNRNCGSGMQALDSAVQSIQSGRSELILAGGAEAMSRAPLLWNLSFLNWMGKWKNARSLKERLKITAQFRLAFLKPEIALLKGLTDSTVGLNMGQTAEELATEFNITREAMDAYALQSHQRLAKAYDEKRLTDEITPLMDPVNGKFYTEDDGLRRNISLEALGKLPPFFDKKYGRVTAGNSSQITDGACLLLLASEKAVKQYDLPILAKIQQVQWVGLEPSRMGLGSVLAASALLKRRKMTMDDVQYWEINEAFAAQILSCFSPNASSLAFDSEKVNVDGGAISLGHPVGASGARIVLHLLHVLKQKNKKTGMAALCIGGGQGGAMLVERV